MSSSDHIEQFQGSIAADGSRRRLIGIAVVFIVLGALAIVEPLVAGLAVTALVGWVLTLGGVMHVIAAFREDEIGHAIFQAAVGVVYVIGGVYFLGHPLIALGTLTLLLTVVLFVEAVLNLAAYFAVWREEGSGWILLNAFVTALLAVLIWRQWPSSSIWVIGTLVGVNLLMHGFSRLMLDAAARHFRRRATI